MTIRPLTTLEEPGKSSSGGPTEPQRYRGNLGKE